jgi:hypothetical protein
MKLNREASQVGGILHFAFLYKDEGIQSVAVGLFINTYLHWLAFKPENDH